MADELLPASQVERRKEEKKPLVQPHPMIAGTSGGVALAWAWNTYVPSHPMPAEVAVALAPMVGYTASWLLSWLSKPRQME